MSDDSGKTVNPGPEPKPVPWLQRWAETAGHVLSLITAGVVAISLLAIIGLAAWDSVRNAVVLDLIEVPESLAKRGYTSVIVTRELADAIRDIQRESQKVERQRRRLVVRGSGALSFTWTGTSLQLDDLMESGAVEIIKNVDPYVAALYYFNTDPKISSDILQHLCLTRPPETDDPWALALLGYISRAQERHGLARQEF